MTHDDLQSEDSESSKESPASSCEDDHCQSSLATIWHCVDCDSSYCADCWPRQGPHKPRKKGRDGVPHEKTNPHVVRRLKAILHPTRRPEEIQKLHEDDSSTKWFGVARDLTGRPNFEDYGRYATLMSSISPIESLGNRYPQLVSFIGITNAGKSTLIKMLVNHDPDLVIAANRSMFPSPVVGSVVNDTLPTSGDVHLYADPATHAEQLPILYADCEGFEGGERTPLGARARRRARSDPAKEDWNKPAHVYARPIEWANTEESRQREYAVTALYPRLLYTFSVSHPLPTTFRILIRAGDQTQMKMCHVEFEPVHEAGCITQSLRPKPRSLLIRTRQLRTAWFLYSVTRRRSSQPS